MAAVLLSMLLVVAAAMSGMPRPPLTASPAHPWPGDPVGETHAVTTPPVFDATAAPIATAVEPFLAGRIGRVAVALVAPSAGEVYLYHADERFAAHSTIKLAMLGATLSHAEAQRREPTELELDLLSSIILWSDNDAATWLFIDLTPAVIQNYLDAIGVGGMSIYEYDWGESAVTSIGLVRLLASIDRCDGFSPASCRYARSLFAGLEPSEHWGPPHALSQVASFTFKNGWYPDEDTWTWRVHSVASVEPKQRPNARFYLAVLTEYPLDLDLSYGVETIERVSALAWTALFPDLPVSPPLTLRPN